MTSDMTFTLNVLPAEYGDSLIVTYGPKGEHHVLIDGGTAHSYKVGGLHQYLVDNPTVRHFELMIVTHVDTDHVDGALCFLNDVRAGDMQDVTIDEVWFNGYEQLSETLEDRGAKQGEYFTHLLRTLKFDLNKAFDRHAVYRNLGREIRLPGGARLTVLTPGKPEIERMCTEWEATCKEAGYNPGDSEAIGKDLAARKERMYNPELSRGEAMVVSERRPGADTSPPNGSSIGVLFEYRGKRMLLGADAHARTMSESIRRYNAQWGVRRMVVDLFKLPHHGSVANMTAEVLDLIECRQFVVSSDGARFHHPDVECLRLIEDSARSRPKNQPTTVYFNYAQRMADFEKHEGLRGSLRLEASNAIVLG
jgi:beta-lactamase superfamily II metal-dependent hydrolase